MFTAAGFAAGTGREPGPGAAASRAAPRRTSRGAGGSFECGAEWRGTPIEGRRRAGLATFVSPGCPDAGADG